MKLAKILSVILILSLICCSFISCDSSKNGEDDIDDLDERDFYDITVSFQVKDANGVNRIDAVDFNYKGHKEPTILNILENYLSVVVDWTCKIDKTDTITQIGGMKANKNNAEYWGFVNGQINLSKFEVMDELSEGKMSNTNHLLCKKRQLSPF